ncbi:response regulator [Solibacillus sp. FSL H8-0538]|uniref:response regulator n=1 Tax=Solibacillus sp. FSL H8-0538 TaxID=2921400 RepID=UPI0030F69013
MTNLSVFIVEDDPMVLEVNKGFLNQMTGFQLVGEASSGKEALQQIYLLQPNLILLDMFLPDMTGMDLFLKLRSDRIPADIILITAARDAPTVREAIRLGAVDYLIKPFRFERFQKALQGYYRTSKNTPISSTLKQEDVDQWLGHTEDGISLPKGLNDMTMKQIIEGLIAANAAITSELLAQNVGMARVTVRKYLAFLANKGKVHIDLKYGTVGRPTKYYSLR